jgi:homoserine kinase type II
MAVYTKVSEEELRDFLEGYDLGQLASFEGIEEGVENTNYHLFTTKGRYILTLFEKRVNPSDLPFFFAFTDHLTDAGIKCPGALPDKNGKNIGELCSRPAAVISFLEGEGLEIADITADHCRQLGREAGRMHEAAAGFNMSRKNSVGLPMWKELAKKAAGRADEVEKGLADLISGELEYLENNWPSGLPEAAVHADIFPDNVFFKDGKISGFIDFYFTATEYLAYDLALVINAWCFDTGNSFVRERFEALMNSYEAVRSLNDKEIKNLSVLCRGAAMRILITRLHDWLYHPPDAIAKPKDPREYIEKLLFHQNDGLPEPDGREATG